MLISMKNGENLYKIEVEEMKNGSECTDHPASVNPDRKRGELKRFKFQGQEDKFISLVRVHKDSYCSTLNSKNILKKLKTPKQTVES